MVEVNLLGKKCCCEELNDTSPTKGRVRKSQGDFLVHHFDKSRVRKSQGYFFLYSFRLFKAEELRKGAVLGRKTLTCQVRQRGESVVCVFLSSH